MKNEFKSILAILGAVILFLGVLLGIVLVAVKKLSVCQQLHYAEDDDLWDEEWDEEDWRVSEKAEAEEDLPF